MKHIAAGTGSIVIALLMLSVQVPITLTSPPPAFEAACLGEFVKCAQTKECVMSTADCGKCNEGEYLCPSDQQTCVANAESYVSCPHMRGTHLDWLLPMETRLDYLVKHTNLSVQINQLQNVASEIRELGIPAYQFTNDDQHGVARSGAHATIFGNGCSLGATWNPQLLREVGDVVGVEARGLHNGFLAQDNSRNLGCNGCGITLYAPNLNLVHDPRWGRAQEVFGEDPHHMARLVTSYVQGAQNNTQGWAVNTDNGHQRVGMCCKHFAVYNQEGDDDGWRQKVDVEVNNRDFWETYMPAFKACTVEAQAAHVMCSYNKVNGKPACANGGLLNTVLRENWNWDGFVVSDYDAWAQLFETHHYAESYEDAAAFGLNAGMDQEGGGDVAIAQLSAAIRDGKTTAEAVALAFRRLFRARVRLGMLDPPTHVPYNQIRYNSTELEFDSVHLSVARRAAREGICLYKNVKSVLPLQGTPQLAVIGPHANMPGVLFGNYAEFAAGGNWGNSIVQSLQGRAHVAFAQGCNEIRCEWPYSNDSFASAQAAAASADVVIIVLGTAFNEFCTGTNQSKNDYCEAEGTDRNFIELPAGQEAMVAAVRAATNKSIIGILTHGGTIALNEQTLNSFDAIVDAWQPGIEGANAIADVLFGDYSPAGRTAVTWYPSTASLALGHGEWNLKGVTSATLYPDEKGNGTTYRFYKGKRPIFPFGFGLSYTTFAYSDLHLSPSSPGPCDTITATVTVTNVGDVDSDEVVQVYVKQPDATVLVPQVRLASFARVHLPKGHSRTVKLEVLPETHIAVYNGDASGEEVYTGSSSVVVEAGLLEIFVGGGQPDYYPGHVAGSVRISGTSPLYKCTPELFI